MDQRLVRDHHIERCDACALALYLFLVTVGDAKKLSYDSDATFARRWSMNPSRLAQARQELIGAGLIAYERPRLTGAGPGAARGLARSGVTGVAYVVQTARGAGAVITYETFCQIKDDHKRRD